MVRRMASLVRGSKIPRSIIRMIPVLVMHKRTTLHQLSAETTSMRTQTIGRKEDVVCR